MSHPSVLGDPRDRAVAQRFEAKYLVSEVQADLVRNYIAPYVRPDRHGPQYPVTSVYLDSPDLLTFTSSLCGEKNRYKLRIRSYTADLGEPVFCEVKQRVGRVIRKHRACVGRDGVEGLFRGGPPDKETLLAPEDAIGQENLMLFIELGERMGAEPKVGVRYTREAYESVVDEPVRVTLDRDIAFAPIPRRSHDLWSAAGGWCLVDEMPIILEVKFTDAFPCWVRRMIQRFELERISLAKYVVCVKAMQREGRMLRTSDRSLSAWNG